MRILLLFCWVSFPAMFWAQSVGVNTASPDPSAALEVKSSSMGFLPPRLTTTQRDAIPSPAPGLTIFNQTTRCLEFYDGANWISLCNSVLTCGSVAGTAAGSVSVGCPSFSLTLTLTGYAGSIQWQSSLDNSSWADIVGANSASQPVSGVSATTYYRAKVTAANCSPIYSNVVTVTAISPSIPTTSLVLRMDAATGVSQDGTGHVSGWSDQSGNRNNAAQAASAQRPAYIASAVNGLPALDFDGTDDYLDAGSGASLNFSDFSFFAVVSLDVLNQYQTILSRDDGSGPLKKWIWWLDTNLGLHQNRPGGPAESAFGTSNPPANTYVLVEVHMTGPAVKLFRNGASTGTATLSTGLPTGIGSVLYIGRTNEPCCGNGYLNGKIAEILMYGTELSDTVKEQVRCQLRRKYNLY